MACGSIPANHHLDSLTWQKQNLIPFFRRGLRSTVRRDHMQRMLLQLNSVEAGTRCVEDPQSQPAISLNGKGGVDLAVGSNQATLAAHHSFHHVGFEQLAVAAETELLQDKHGLRCRGDFGDLIQFTANDEDSGQAARNLTRDGFMHVRVIPERAAAMVRREVEFVGERLARSDAQHHVVGMA